jgi:poly(3-hydroxybutyrate) depolymerase
LHWFDTPTKPALLYAPPRLPHWCMPPLLVTFHGATGVPGDMLTLLRTEAAQRKVLLLAPSSEQVTWDAIADGTFGKDAASVQHAMATVFDHFAVDRDRIAVAGFASYALGLGLTNGDLFTRVLPTPPAASRRAAATAA